MVELLAAIELSPLEATPAPAVEAPSWPWPAAALLLVMGLLAVVGARRLRQRLPAPPDRLQLGRSQLNELGRLQPPLPVMARESARILCDSLAHHYGEPLLLQSAALILQRRAFLRQLPETLRPPLLLFLADCLEAAYRPERGQRDAEDLLASAEQILRSVGRNPAKS